MIQFISNHDPAHRKKHVLPLILTDGEASITMTFMLHGGAWDWIGLINMISKPKLQMLFIEYCINHDIRPLELGQHFKIISAAPDEISKDWK